MILLYASIELGRESSVRVVRKQPGDLTQGDSCRGELREFIPTEECYLTCFQTWGGISCYEVTQEERLVDMEQHGGMLMPISIIQRDQFADPRLKARLLLYFPYDCRSRRLPNVGPPAWERP